jgi:type 1 glutamine amidotransferase
MDEEEEKDGIRTRKGLGVFYAKSIYGVGQVFISNLAHSPHSAAVPVLLSSLRRSPRSGFHPYTVMVRVSPHPLNIQCQSQNTQSSRPQS